MYRILLSCLFLVIGLSTASSQKSGEGPGLALLVHFNYAFNIPGGDLADLYGNNFTLGSGIELITSKKNYILGLEGGFLFGNTVKQDVIASLRTPGGGIIGDEQVYADIVLRQRGLRFSGHIGKLFDFSKDEDGRAGLRATIGLGLLQHKVRIQDDFNSFAPQLNDDYKKGYDKLTNGLSVTEFIGYQMLSTNRLLNFYIGMEFVQGFTQNRRDWDFAERRKIDEARFDSIIGFKVGWTLPFYIGQAPETIFY